ncbi:glycosyltransferase family 52 [Robiginitalea aurantiaca]|uniref:Glycosyltransferase family 52 n=1 Tax=Robiginitalea aurantiaca TaxID=3056915 RepID=A0ABT7WBS0_9FLAO|nr:glycosyltransferase family 52 [Robiginitalea aurantiaca]MDM9630361.1 glycosyltransferase family 52 [Robiginitalea aurantiaca]
MNSVRRTYVGSTIYHIYLAFLHILKNSPDKKTNRGDNLLFLVESTPMIESLIPNLKKSFFRDVHIISERKDHVADLGKFNYAFRRRKKLIPYLEAKHPILKKEKEFIQSSDLFLCDTDSSKSYFIYEFGQKGISMIEDGARTYRQRHSPIEQYIKSFITKTPIGGGFDREVKTLYAQFPDRLPSALQKKAVELNIKKEVAGLDAETKQEIFEVFLPADSFKVEGDNTALILTQPLSEDKMIRDEAEKIAIYKDVLSRVPPEMNIILKMHPRETTRYEKHFDNITVLPGLFPIEILELRSGFHFEQGYTLWSTGLSNLENVKERFFLGKDYLDKISVKAVRDLIENMVIEN